MPPTNGGPHCRLSSPSGGGSTLMTCAPMSASIIVQIGPERILERSTTNRSSRGRIGRNHNELGWSFPPAVASGGDSHSFCTDFVTKGFYFGRPLLRIYLFPTNLGSGFRIAI